MSKLPLRTTFYLRARTSSLTQAQICRDAMVQFTVKFVLMKKSKVELQDYLTTHDFGSQ